MTQLQRAHEAREERRHKNKNKGETSGLEHPSLRRRGKKTLGQIIRMQTRMKRKILASLGMRVKDKEVLKELGNCLCPKTFK